MSERAAVLQYDLSGRAGYAIWAPGLAKPYHGILNLPPSRTNGSNGPALKLLFEHVTWADRNFGLAHIGFELFIAATGSRELDAKTTFVTSPKTQRKQIGLIAAIDLCAEILEIDATPVHNMSWRTLWLGSQPRGTKRDRWKVLAVNKARSMGWDPKGDDDADAIGQLHWLLAKLDIRPDWLPTGQHQLNFAKVAATITTGERNGEAKRRRIQKAKERHI